MIKRKRWKAWAFGTCALLLSAASTLPVMAVHAQSSAPEDASTSAMAVSDSGSSDASSDASSSDSAGSATSNIASGTGETFTPDGNGTLVDSATSADNKHFYTIQTPAGNYFYLIVDGDRDSDNVYMTSLITEQELLSMIEQQSDDGTATGSGSSSILPSERDVFGDGSTGSSEDGESTEDASASDEVDSVEKAKESSSKQNTMYLIIFLITVICVAAFFIYKAIKEKNGDYDDDFEDDEEYEEEEDEDEDGEGRSVEKDEDEDGEEADVKKNEYRPRNAYRNVEREKEVGEDPIDRFQRQERRAGVRHTATPDQAPSREPMQDRQSEEALNEQLQRLRTARATDESARGNADGNSPVQTDHSQSAEGRIAERLSALRGDKSSRGMEEPSREIGDTDTEALIREARAIIDNSRTSEENSRADRANREAQRRASEDPTAETEGFMPPDEEESDMSEEFGEISGDPDEDGTEEETENNSPEKGEEDHMEYTQNVTDVQAPVQDQAPGQAQPQNPAQNVTPDQTRSQESVQAQQREEAATPIEKQLQEPKEQQEQEEAFNEGFTPDNDDNDTEIKGFDPEENQSEVQNYEDEILPGAEENSEDDYEEEDPVDIIMQKIESLKNCAEKYREISGQIVEYQKKLEELSKQQSEMYVYIKNFGALAEKL